ncbi:hypothetical protein GCM10010279_27120 [Streptomyces mutabilis]|nr:hypothetical protein GCM10010279_27120 [Streptomyces mutabilis]
MVPVLVPVGDAVLVSVGDAVLVAGVVWAASATLERVVSAFVQPVTSSTELPSAQMTAIERRGGRRRTELMNLSVTT